MAVIDQPINKSGQAELVITRKFNAPKEMIFKSFSEAARLEKWWGPKGSQLKVRKLDFKTGGMFLYSMDFEGQIMWGRFIYGQILRPYSIEFINSFSDENGNITRAPFSQVWPLEIYNSWTLSENEGMTTLTLRGYPINASEEEIKTFIDFQSSMQQGFTGTFDQLEDYLSQLYLHTAL
jgi:uncharacterized protein YndB with AHSA1/START domain